MKKHHMLKKPLSSGYTIIEVLIAIFILVIIFSITSANLRGYSQQKNLEQAEKQVRADLKLAQGYALAGKLLAGCSGLDGYAFSASSTNDTYTVFADCVTDVNVPNKANVALPEGMQFASDAEVLFRVMGKGTDIPTGSNVTFTIVQNTTGGQVQIKVNSVGLIE